MRTLIVSSSPHKNGLCAIISNEVANGVNEANGEPEIIFLAEKALARVLAHCVGGR